MDRFLIRGGRVLSGRVATASAKNAVLPILAACLLTGETCTIRNVPRLEDVKTMLRLLQTLGVTVEWSGRTVRVTAKGKLSLKAPYDIVRKMRASYYVLGPLLARFGDCLVSLPGGCAIGPRPVDLHLRGIEALGARVSVEHGYIHAQGRPLKGGRVFLEGVKGPSVGATINTLMAATLARGKTVIEGAACEPEVVDVARFLKTLGAEIKGAGTPTITINGRRELHGASHRPIPDRIEAGTLAVAAAITGGKVEIVRCRPRHLGAVIELLRQVGAEVITGRQSLTVAMKGRAKPVDIATGPYPSFPTDLQAQFTSLLSLADGTSVVTENIFESRFLHCLELNRMGANIELAGSHAIIHGVDRLSGAQVMASDLRASAALVLAGLAAEGETEILRIYHLDRGYERLEEKLTGLGAEIERVSPRSNA
ncbi:MAG: UDP-N-acetylglucosamine 1-carboxyvinyltransferase [candidate division WOR-3 bacterium]